MTAKISLQKLYKAIEIALQDSSKQLAFSVSIQGKDCAVWPLLEKKIAAAVAAWPEWGAALNPNTVPKDQFKRYAKLAKPQKVTTPKNLSELSGSFQKTLQELVTETEDYLRQAIAHNITKFSNHPQYQSAASCFSVEKLQKIPEALPLADACCPTLLTQDVIDTIFERLQKDINTTKNLGYPYENRPFPANLALVLRVQVQLKKTYCDKISRLIAAAESEFRKLFCQEIFRGEILPHIRNFMNDSKLLKKIS